LSNPRTTPLLPALCEQLHRGLIDRRAFVRLATLFGVAAGAAYAMAGLAGPAMAGGTLPFPADDPAAKRGGKLRVGQMVARMQDPATYNWTEMANQTRPILEYLTMLGPDNVVRPMLAE
jgi:peptide/nickel transport system substrate-binding protein